MRYKNIAGTFFELVTDGQNYDFHDRDSIAASRRNNEANIYRAEGFNWSNGEHT